MSLPPTSTNVIVLAPDGRTSRLATLHDWIKRDDGWWGQCKVFQDEGGQRWETVHESRILKLECCDFNPYLRQTSHHCEGHDLMRNEDQVWA